MHLFPRFGNHTCFGLFLLHMSFLSMSVHLFSGFCYKAFITFFIDSVNHRTISCCYNVTVYHYMCIILPYKNSKRDKLMITEFASFSYGILHDSTPSRASVYSPFLYICHFVSQVLPGCRSLPQLHL